MRAPETTTPATSWCGNASRAPIIARGAAPLSKNASRSSTENRAVMKAIYIEQTGSPDVLRFGDRPDPEPAPGEVLVKLAVSGVNFTDLNARSGINKLPLPAILGSEAAGTVERAGEGVTGFQPGD